MTGRLGLLLLVLLCAAGCRSVERLAPADLTAPGWVVRHGQAVWKTAGSDLAGELIFGVGPKQNSWLQFIKTPLPLVSAQTRGGQWTIHFAAENRTMSGKGTPPPQLLWVHLAKALQGLPSPKAIAFKADLSGNWELVNPKTGEEISGFLMP